MGCEECGDEESVVWLRNKCAYDVGRSRLNVTIQRVRERGRETESYRRQVTRLCPSLSQSTNPQVAHSCGSDDSDGDDDEFDVSDRYDDGGSGGELVMVVVVLLLHYRIGVVVVV